MDEFKEIFFFSVSLILIAFVINFFILLGTTSRQIAETRNIEIMSAEDVRIAKKHSAYNNQNITGADVILALRENTKTGSLQIYIDKNINGTSMTMNESNYKNNTWKLSTLLQSIKGDSVYKAILVFGNDNPASAVYVANSNSMVTGIKFTKV